MNLAESRNAKIIVIPEKTILDEKVSIKVIGLPPNILITLRAKMKNYVCCNTPYFLNNELGRETEWESYATFLTDENGEVHLESQEPIEGTYKGKCAMGLFWSMEVKEPIKSHHSLQLCDLKPTRERLVNLYLELQDKVITSIKYIRYTYKLDVKETEVIEEGLAGRFFTIPNGEKKPGILVVSGSDGGIQKAQAIAALFASHGYAALALGYFELQGLPEKLVNIPIEYFLKGIKWLKNQPEVIPDKIMIFGRSKGGELALTLAASCSDIKAVIAHTPSAFITQGLDEQRKPVKESSWTYNNQPLPYFRIKMSAYYQFIIKKIMKKPARISDLFLHSLKSKKNLEASAITVENINGPILLISSGDDAVWPSECFCEIIAAKLKNANFPYNFKHLSYKNAGHYITLPFEPTPTLRGNGGTIQENAKASEDSWYKILAFLEKFKH